VWLCSGGRSKGTSLSQRPSCRLHHAGGLQEKFSSALEKVSEEISQQKAEEVNTKNTGLGPVFFIFKCSFL